MRSIPAALKTKLLNRFKADDTNSRPNLRLVATQTSINTLLSEPIHEDIAPDLGDVAVRQMEGENNLSRAYAICLDHGIAQICTRRFPAGFDYKWEYLWTFGAASDVAIEYNGTWRMNAAQEWYFLQTEEHPYIFTVEGGNLYVQHWDNAATRIQLANGVSQISSCKGWQSSVDIELDQGLIIGYLRGGTVFYRALCCQSDGSYIWEAEHEVTELGTDNKTLSVIRTNDFRIGFLTENSGNILLALTHRNYAGMSVRPETVHINAAKARIWMDYIREQTTLDMEYASADVTYPYLLLDLPDSEVISVVSAEKINRSEGFSCYGFKLRLSKPLHGAIDAGFIPKCTLSVSSVSEAVYSSEEQAILLYTNTDIRRTIPVTITMPECRAALYIKQCGQKWFLPALSAEVEAEAMEYQTFEHETAAISTLLTDLWIDEAVFTWLFQSPCTAIIEVATASVILQPVSTLPI